jgi:peptidyl-prolyl cis-trans isomerase A (cyclophilin A)
MPVRFLFTLLVLAPLFQVKAGTLAQFRTIYGDIEVELFDTQKPVTVQNFIRYVESGRYQNTFFHRCVPNFVLQGGGFVVPDRSSTASFQSAFGVPSFGPITNEFNIGPLLSNTYGTIAMAKMSAPNSATSQFFFNTTNNAAALDNTNNSGGFTVFGRVVRGTNVLNGFNSRALGLGVVDMRWWYDGTQFGNLFKELPVNYFGQTHPRYVDLIYVDVTLLSVQISLTNNNARAIAWNSVAGKTNIVEYTSSFPPTWQLLVQTNGNGNRFSVVDAAADPNRFYRVRVNY